MKSTRQQVFEAINTERAYQDKKWTPETTISSGIHSIEEWIMYIEDYLDEAKHTLSREPKQICDPKALHIMRKVAAMAVACMEQNGAYNREGEPTEQLARK
jgi:hypothetical protein